MSKRMIIFTLILLLMSSVAVPSFADTTPAVPADNFLAPFTETACEEDLTGEEVVFYHFGDLSGPFAFITQPLIAGLEDAAGYINANGGLCGATIVQEYRDTGGSPDQSQVYWDEFSAEDDAYAIFLYSSADAELLRDQAAEAEIPLLIAAGSEIGMYGENGDEPGYNFGLIPLYSDQLGAFCDYVSENWDSMEMEGDPTIGHLSWAGAFGESSDTEQSRAYCEAAGVGYAGAEYFAPGTSDISTQLRGLVDNGANIIYTTSLASGPAQVAGTVAALDLGDSLIVAGSNWALDTSVIGLGGAATNGIIGALPSLWWDEMAEPSVAIVNGYWGENRLAENPEEAIALRNIAYLISVGAIDVWMESMIRAINEVGFENLSGADLYESLQTLENYGAFGGMFIVDFTDGKRATSTTRIGQIQFLESEQGVTPSVVPLVDWFEAPDLKPGGADVPE